MRRPRLEPTMRMTERQEAIEMRVADVMTTQVVAVRPDTSLKEVAELLSGCGISGAPVVDADGRVLGVVSEADILVKERRPRSETWLERLLRRPTGDPKAAARTAGEAMSWPAVTISASRRVDAAAARMLDRSVNRLPVVDEAGKLVGIVTRADLVRAFVRTDEQIAREIREDVLIRELWLDPGDFRVSVTGGDVAIEGELGSEDERMLLVRRIRLVPGVVSVAVHARADR